jgi:aspartyl protease family protein
MVSQQGMIGTSLLGMSFLGRLSSFEVRGDKLILHD